MKPKTILLALGVCSMAAAAPSGRAAPRAGAKVTRGNFVFDALTKVSGAIRYRPKTVLGMDLVPLEPIFGSYCPGTGGLIHPQENASLDSQTRYRLTKEVDALIDSSQAARSFARRVASRHYLFPLFPLPVAWPTASYSLETVRAYGLSIVAQERKAQGKPISRRDLQSFANALGTRIATAPQ